jgi:hypothetical protein
MQFHMPLYKFLYNLLKVLVQIANKLALLKTFCISCHGNVFIEPLDSKDSGMHMQTQTPV